MSVATAGPARHLASITLAALSNRTIVAADNRVDGAPLRFFALTDRQSGRNVRASPIEAPARRVSFRMRAASSVWASSSARAHRSSTATNSGSDANNTTLPPVSTNDHGFTIERQTPTRVAP